VQVADINGDGLTDIITSQYNNELRYYEQTSIGQFANPVIITSPILIADVSGGFTLSDMDGDGDIDVFLVGITQWSGFPVPPSDTDLGILLNDGNGQFTLGDAGFVSHTDWQLNSDFRWALMPTIGRSPIGEPTIKFLAINVGATAGLYQYEFIIGNGNEQLTPMNVSSISTIPTMYNTESYFVQVESVQFDTDTELETLAHSYHSLTFDAASASAHSFVTDSTYAISTMPIDIDGDGDLDIATLERNQLWQEFTALYLNDGLGNFTTAGPFTGPIGVAADIDADGDEDIIDWKGQTYLSNGSGIFTQINTVILPDYTTFYLSNAWDLPPVVHLSSDPADPSFAVLFNRDGDAPVPSGLGYVSIVSGCPQDLTNDGLIDVNDFLMFNTDFGTSCTSCPEDLTGDGVVDINDFLMLNSAFGTACQ
jgi:hypothetical protein